jgi:histidinol-phosphate aminotransferase
MKVKNLVEDRRALCKQIRENTFSFLEKKGISFVPSQGNFFMMEVKRKGADFARKMADEKIIIGGIWPVWPTKVRVTVGAMAEMTKFNRPVAKIMG